MKISNFSRLVRVIAFGAVLVALTGVGLISRGQVGRTGQGAHVQLPKGNWTFSAVPQVGTKYITLPVDVFKVKTNAAQGLTIESVSLFNRSLQNVKEVRLHWYLKEKSQKNILAEGDTDFFNVTLPAGGRVAIDYPIVSFDKLSRNFTKDGALTGDFRIEVVVADLNFTNGSKWNFKTSGPVKLNHALSILPDPGCQGQGCVWNGAEGSYACGALEGSFCSVTGQGQSCTVERCPIGN